MSNYTQGQNVGQTHVMNTLITLLLLCYDYSWFVEKNTFRQTYTVMFLEGREMGRGVDGWNCAFVFVFVHSLSFSCYYALYAN